MSIRRSALSPARQRATDSSMSTLICFRREAHGFAGPLYSHEDLAMALAVGQWLLPILSETGAPN